MRPSAGARKRRVARAPSEATAPQSGLLAPALSLTADCDVPPPAGIPPKRPPTTFAAPSATSSPSASGWGSPLRRNARPIATVSMKLMSAIPTAPGQSSWASDGTGAVKGGNPAGTFPTVATPRAARPRTLDAAMPSATATSGAGSRGATHSRRKIRARSPPPTRSVGRDASPTCRTIATTSRKKPVFTMWNPRSFGTWSTMMTSPSPALKPVRTGSEMRFATAPRRRTRARRRMTPTRTESVAPTASAETPLPSGARRAISAAVRIAIVVVVLMLRGRELPRRA